MDIYHEWFINYEVFSHEYNSVSNSGNVLLPFFYSAFFSFAFSASASTFFLSRLFSVLCMLRVYPSWTFSFSFIHARRPLSYVPRARFWCFRLSTGFLAGAFRHLFHTHARARSPRTPSAKHFYQVANKQSLFKVELGTLLLMPLVAGVNDRATHLGGISNCVCFVRNAFETLLHKWKMSCKIIRFVYLCAHSHTVGCRGRGAGAEAHGWRWVAYWRWGRTE